MAAWPEITDYLEAIQDPAYCFSDPDLKSGKPSLDRMGLPKPITGGFASVYQLDGNGRRYAVRCFLKQQSDQEERYIKISQHLSRLKLPYMVDFDFLKQGIKIKGNWYPILKMEWLEGDPLNTFIEKNLNNPQVLQSLAGQFLDLAGSLKQNSIAHGDLQHANIIIVKNQFRLIDYDGMYVPGMEGLPAHEVGHRHYQHPLRSERDFGPYLDNFSSWVIYVSLLAFSFEPGLWNRLKSGDEYLLFQKDDFEKPDSSEAWLALQQIQNPSLQNLIYTFRQIVSLSGLPNMQSPLDFPVTYVTKPTTVGSTAVATGSGGPAWYFSQLSGPVPQSNLNLAPTGAGWVLDHLNQPQVKISGSFKPERIAAIGFLQGIVALGILLATQILAPLVGVAILFILGALLGGLLVGRYRVQPAQKERKAVNRNYQAVLKERGKVDRALKNLQKQKEEIIKQRNIQLEDLAMHQKECDTRERRELDQAEHKLNQEIVALNHQRQAVNQREANEIAGVQAQYVTKQLASVRIEPGAITGIGPALIANLSIAGINTAADILGIQTKIVSGSRYSREVVEILVAGRGPVHVEGIGPAKAKNIKVWRQMVESRIKASISNSATHALEASIRIRYEAERINLNTTESQARQNLVFEKNNIAAKFRSERENLAQQPAFINAGFAKPINEIENKMMAEQRQWSEKDWALARCQKELDAYCLITFGNYLKSALLFRKST